MNLIIPIIFIFIILIILVFMFYHSYKNIGVTRTIFSFLYFLILFLQLSYFKKGIFVDLFFNKPFETLLNITLVNIVISLLLFLSSINFKSEGFKIFSISILLSQSAFSMMMTTEKHNDPMNQLLYSLAYMAIPIIIAANLGKQGKIERDIMRIEDRIKNIENSLNSNTVPQKSKCKIRRLLNKFE